MKEYLKRLLPAAQATALIAAIVHVVSLAVVSASTSNEPFVTAFLKYLIFESIFIALLTYIIALIVAISVGTMLLVVVGFFRLGLISSLLLFLITAQVCVVALSTYLFEYEINDMPWQYAAMTVPPTIAAWYFSVYYVWKKARVSEIFGVPL